jgi:hypothetical protein
MKRPPGGFRFERPGFEFYTAAMKRFLGGYEPVLAAEMCKKPRGGTSAIAAATRDAALTAGESWAGGTIYGMGPPDEPGKAMRLRKPSQLG